MVKYKRLKADTSNISDSQKILIMIAICMIIGSMIGSIMANRIGTIEHHGLRSQMDYFLNNFDHKALVKQDVVIQSFFTYGAGVILVWFLGFITFGSFIALFIIALRGTSIGFTTSFLVMEYGHLGVWYASIIYMPQNIILFFVYAFIVYSSIRFTMEYMKKKKNKNFSLKSVDSEILEYVVVLFLSLTLIFLVSLYEAYIAPNLIYFLL